VRLRPGDAPLARQLAVAVAAVLPLVAWWLRRWPEAPAALLPPCLMRAATGLPCPTCGGTHALVDLAHGRLASAFTANPLVSLGTLALVLWSLAGVAVSVVPRWRRRVEASPGDGRRLLVLVLALIAASWTWQLAS
jgi:hypothetical protein